MSTMGAHIEIFIDGQWVRAAALDFIGHDRCRFEYLPQYIFGADPQPLSLNYPAQFSVDATLEDGQSDRRPPPFVYDLVPQGRGRQYLISLLGLKDADNLVGPLVEHGAFNPIGRLRIDTAVGFFQNQTILNPESGHQFGFDFNDIVNRSEDFLEHLSLRAMLAAGTTGVQGVAPKFLLTQDDQQRWHADMTLPDDRAAQHWLVKLPRGRTQDDILVHRNEAAYMRVARACGLRTHGEPMLHGDMLFLPRFDRVVGQRGLQRLHQESLASLVGLRGFGQAATQNHLLQAVWRHASDPLAETIEFFKRDILNFALRNTDNHARNSAMQRLENGVVQLTPVFDFSPMFKDPEVITRSIHWRDEKGIRIDAWTDVIDALDITPPNKAALSSALRDFGDTINNLEAIAVDCGVDKVIIDACQQSMDRQARLLQDIPVTQTQVQRGESLGG